MSIAVYLRFSKKDQATPGAVGSHEWMARKAIAQIGGNPDEAVFYVDKKSGWKKNVCRENFDVLLKRIAAGDVTILVARQDRLSRDTTLFLDLAKLLEKSKCKFWDIIKARFIDFSNPDEWAEYMRAGIGAERESRVNSRRHKDRKEYMRVQGLVQGGHAPYGYRRSPSGQYEIDPDTHQNVLRIFEIFLESSSGIEAVRRIRNELGVEFTGQGFNRWITNLTLRGHTPYKCRNEQGNPAPPQEVRWHTHEAVMDEATWQKINAVLHRNKDKQGSRRGGDKKRVYALSGLLVCGRCGGSCLCRTNVNTYGKEYPRIFCFNSVEGRGCGGGIGRKKRSGLNTDYKLAEDSVIDTLVERAEEIAKAVMLKAPTQVVDTPEISKLRSQIQKLEAIADDDPDTQYLLTAKRNKLTELLEMNGAIALSVKHGQDKLTLFGRNRRFWENAKKEELQVLFLEFVDKVICDGDKVVVKLKV